jgi:peptidoglycan/LPS O-acetylase OafA/YrhL
LRALAILVVVVWHIAVRTFRLTLKGPMVNSDNAGFLHWMPHGEIGVSLFFFISGFIIVRPFLEHTQTMAPRDILPFYTRRLLRIAPPHYLMVTIAMVVLGVIGYQPERAVSFQTSHQSLWASYAASLFYANGLVFGTPPRLNPPTWSLEIEMQFYLIAPAIIMLYLRAGNRLGMRLAGIGAFAFAVLTFGVIAALGAYSPLRWTVISYMYLFLLGVFVAGREVAAGVQNRRSGGGDALFVAGVILLAGSGLFRDQMSPVADALRLAVTMAAVLALFYGAMVGRIASTWLGSKWIALIGAMSYSIYLTHVVVIQALATILFKVVDAGDTAGNMALALGACVPAVLGVGMSYYVVVERRFMRLGRHARQPGWKVQAARG